MAVTHRRATGGFWHCGLHLSTSDRRIGGLANSGIVGAAQLVHGRLPVAVVAPKRVVPLSLPLRGGFDGPMLLVQWGVGGVGDGQGETSGAARETLP